MKAVKVQYTVREDYVETNKRNIEAVMSELRGLNNLGLKYSSFLLDDGKTFVHFNMYRDEQTIAEITNKTYGVVKHLLHNARKTMTGIFDDTCALVSQKGVCNQCSELNGKFNPKQDRQAELMKIKLVKERSKHNIIELYTLRTELIKAIDPLQANGSDLHEVLMSVNHRVNCEPK
jgi:hypothetical protein